MDNSQKEVYNSGYDETHLQSQPSSGRHEDCHGFENSMGYSVTNCQTNKVVTVKKKCN